MKVYQAQKELIKHMIITVKQWSLELLIFFIIISKFFIFIFERSIGSRFHGHFLFGQFIEFPFNFLQFLFLLLKLFNHLRIEFVLQILLAELFLNFFIFGECSLQRTPWTVAFRSPFSPMFWFTPCSYLLWCLSSPLSLLHWGAASASLLFRIQPRW